MTSGSRRRVVAAVGGVVITATLLTGCKAPRWRSTLVSVNGAGTNAGNGLSIGPVFSPDGTQIAFRSSAPDLGATDTNETNDVYVRNLATGTTTLVSTNAAGTQAADGPSDTPVFSPDGRRIAFTSRADDLGPTDTNGVSDVYVRDLATGATTLVSVNGTGGNAGNGASYTPIFSPDGSQLVFLSDAGNLGPTDSPRVGWGPTDVYVRDLQAGTTSLVSANAAGTDSGNGVSTSPVLSPDGTKVAFLSGAGNLGPTDTNGFGDLYVRDLATGTTSLITANVAGTDGGNALMFPEEAVFSPDGAHVYFHSPATNLVTVPDANGGMDVFDRDLTTGTTTLVSTNAAGTSAAGGNSLFPVLSRDGDTLAFTTTAADLGPTDTNGVQDVYLRNVATGQTTLASVNAAGTDSGNHDSFGPLFSADGRTLVFESYAADLLKTATPHSGRDVFARDLTRGATRLVSLNAAGTDRADAYDGSKLGAVSPTDGRIAFVTDAGDLGPVDTSDQPDVYLAKLG